MIKWLIRMLKHTHNDVVGAVVRGYDYALPSYEQKVWDDLPSENLSEKEKDRAHYIRMLRGYLRGCKAKGIEPANPHLHARRGVRAMEVGNLEICLRFYPIFSFDLDGEILEKQKKEQKKLAFYKRAQKIARETILLKRWVSLCDRDAFFLREQRFGENSWDTLKRLGIIEGAL